jgi:hypothetical protein
MRFEQEFPVRFWINLGRREDRRIRMEAVLADAGVTAERLPAVDARRCKVKQGMVRGYESAGRYALALTQRLAIREAKRRGVPAVLLFEDDVVLHPNFRALAEMVELPEDWGIFYFGCAHHAKPEWAGMRVVRCKYAVDTHAVAVKAEYYDRVMQMLDRYGKEDLPEVAKASDQFLAILHREIPSYACYPNLAWQSESTSDLAGVSYSNYHRDGFQKNWTGAVSGLLEELVGGRSAEGGLVSEEWGVEEKSGMNFAVPVKLGLLFLTRDEVNHPEIWQEFVAEKSDGVRVFSHRKEIRSEGGRKGFLDGTEIGEHFETGWGNISLVRATRALLLEAMEDESLTHFALLSEACVPVMPLREILRRLEIDPRSQFDFRPASDRAAVQVAKLRATPQVPKGCWTFTSQWWLMDRTTAVFAAGQDFTGLFEKAFAPDEGYFATVLAMQGYPLSGQVRRRSSTWTKWTPNAAHPEEWPEFPREEIERVMMSGCYFARKFPVGSDVGNYGLHRGSARMREVVA